MVAVQSVVATVSQGSKRVQHAGSPPLPCNWEGSSGLGARLTWCQSKAVSLYERFLRSHLLTWHKEAGEVHGGPGAKVSSRSVWVMVTVQ